MAELLTAENAVALLTLAALEIVLGIDNIVFLAILTGRLPPEQQPLARRVGLGAAAGMRVLLLPAIGWIMGLTAELFAVPAFWTGAPGDALSITGRDLVLLAGGLFLMAKATFEIHDKLEGDPARETSGAAAAAASFGAVVFQVMLIDMVFSLDSVITAVGMVKLVPGSEWVGLTIMITAVLVAVAVMLAFAGAVSRFVERHPTIKMLALSFLICQHNHEQAQNESRSVTIGNIREVSGNVFPVASPEKHDCRIAHDVLTNNVIRSMEGETGKLGREPAVDCTGAVGRRGRGAAWGKPPLPARQEPRPPAEPNFEEPGPLGHRTGPRRRHAA